MAKKEKAAGVKKEKINLKQQRDRLNILIESLAENSSQIFGTLASTETVQALLWYLVSNTNTNVGQAMTTTNKLILAGEVLPGVDLPKGAVLGALLEQGDDIMKAVTSVVERGKDVKEVITGKWWKTSFTRAQCRSYDKLVWESQGKPMYSTTGEEGKNLMPLYTSFISEPYGYKGNDDPEKGGIPAVCVLRNEETGNKDIVARIDEPRK